MSETADYPGRALGLPETGPGSMAGFGRRLVAIFIDWTLCQIIVVTLFGIGWGAGGLAAFAPLAAFVVLNMVSIAAVGATLGHRLLGLQVVCLTVDDPARPHAWVASIPDLMATAIRTALVCLVLPALIWDRDGRGYHDRLARTMILRRPQTR